VVESLVRKLFAGPLDIVGDVHGEIDALRDLLRHLGYAEDGSHPENRRLVFLGDLTDRGPDSPAVIDLVKQFVEDGRAQCVLGNHDLNILLGHRKHDNHWFFGEEWSLDEAPEPTPAVLADDTIRQNVREFFQTLPLAFERDDLRVVHACWDDAMIEIARQHSDAKALYEDYKSQIKAALQRQPELAEHERELQLQNRNPVKVLSSGLEKKVDEQYWASGKWRYLDRVHWWKDYRGTQVCVFGHYSMPTDQSYSGQKALCVDFAVAKRWQERTNSKFTGEFQGKLGALRFPERVVVLDDGSKKAQALPFDSNG
jgi:hypothetical protein